MIRSTLIALPLCVSAIAHADDAIVVEVQGESKKASATTTTSATEAAKAPGTEGDVLKILQSSPGVAHVGVGSSDLLVWGSAPGTTHFYWDGVEVPYVFHGSAFRSVYSSDMVQSVTLLPGAYDASGGRGVGAEVHVRSKEPSIDSPFASLGVDLFDEHAYFATPLGPQWTLDAGGKISWIDRVLDIAAGSQPPQLIAIPRYRDAAARATCKLDDDSFAQVGFVYSDDQSQINVYRSDTSLNFSDIERQRFWRAYVRYGNLADQTQVVGFVGFDHASSNDVWGVTTNASRSLDATVFGLRASTTLLDVKGDWRDPSASLSIGVDSIAHLSKVSQTGSLVVPARPEDIQVYGEPPGPEVLSQSLNAGTANVAPFVRASLRAGDWLVEGGLRGNIDWIETNKTLPDNGRLSTGNGRVFVNVEPRVQASVGLTKSLSAFAAVGRHSQQPSPFDLSPSFGNPSLRPETATHAATGFALAAWRFLSLESVLFYEHVESVVVRNPNPSPPVADNLTNDGQAQSYGVQLVVRVRKWLGCSGWISWTMSRAELGYANQPMQPTQNDQPHNVTLVVQKKIDDWSFGLRARYATGFLRTDVSGAYFDAKADRYQPLFGQSYRLPDFFQLDARIDRSFELPHVRYTASLEVQNITNRNNVEEVVYDASYTHKLLITGLPLVAFVSLQMEVH